MVRPRSFGGSWGARSGIALATAGKESTLDLLDVERIGLGDSVGSRPWPLRRRRQGRIFDRAGETKKRVRAAQRPFRARDHFRQRRKNSQLPEPRDRRKPLLFGERAFQKASANRAQSIAEPKKLLHSTRQIAEHGAELAEVHHESKVRRRHLGRLLFPAGDLRENRRAQLLETHRKRRADRASAESDQVFAVREQKKPRQRGHPLKLTNRRVDDVPLPKSDLPSIFGLHPAGADSREERAKQPRQRDDVGRRSKRGVE